MQIGVIIGIFTGITFLGLAVLIYQRRVSTGLYARLSEKESFISSILQNTVDGVIFIGKNNLVQVWNMGAEMIFEYSADEMMEQSFHRLIPPEKDADEELNLIREKVIRKGYIAK